MGLEEDAATVVGTPGRKPGFSSIEQCLAPGETGWAFLAEVGPSLGPFGGELHARAHQLAQRSLQLGARRL